MDNNINYQSLTKKLKLESARICYLNHCTLSKHKCNSSAFINNDGKLLDICIPDYFKGSALPVAVIPIPFYGNDEELQSAIENQLT